jgi:spectinomycin phosphotransferase
VAGAVNTPPPAGIDERDLARFLARSWALEVGRLRYIPKGFGSYHWLAEARDGHEYFVTVDDLEGKPWLGADHESTFDGLQAAYETALALHQQALLHFVVAPIPELGGRAAVRLTSQYSLAVFEFIDGPASGWGEPISSDDRLLLVHRLAELHLSTPTVASRAPRRGLELPGRAGLEVALEELTRPWDGGPFSEPARRELAANADAVYEWLGSFDALAARVADRAAEPVVTHGEPHPGNLIRVEGGFLLVDWDTVAMGQPERDLWMLDDGSGRILAAYSHTTGRAVDDIAISLYRLSWRLADIASFTVLFRSDHRLNQGTEKAWKALTDSLRSSGSPPYGPAPAAKQ